ncbi:HemK2/MTQ2 family protein methyltransferase [Streptomyces griseosporeus]|uniref:HemK2/MTQ2 family protein methyltransferase n=1 Tax=Streptomyces griseosporeus TaxID=1910 RepID=UPI003798455F
MTSLVLPGVYAPQDDTDLLAGALRDEPLQPGADVLDLGTGSGELAVLAAERGARVTAVDVSWRAVCTTRLNALRARVPLRVRRGDLFGPVRGQQFDLIVSNPPYVPAPAAGTAPSGAARAWDAGRDGRLLLDRICHEGPERLRPGGVLLLVQSAVSGVDHTLDRLRGADMKASVVRRRRIGFGPVLRERAAWLRERGLLPDGEESEELVVVRAERPC